MSILKNKKLLIIVSIVILLIIGGFFAFANPFKNETNDITDDSISYDGPTEDEKKAGDEQKEKIIQDKQKQENQDQSSGKTASVIITDAGQYDDIIEVRSFIPDHYQDGTCTITFTQGSQKVTKNTPAYRDASTTICTNPLFERSEFPAGGSWQVQVSYKSKDASGKSETKTVNIK